MNRILFSILVALLAGLLSATAHAQFGGRAAPVEVDEARLMAMAPTMQVAGTVLSRSDAFLSAEVEGRLALLRRDTGGQRRPHRADVLDDVSGELPGFLYRKGGRDGRRLVAGVALVQGLGLL